MIRVSSHSLLGRRKENSSVRDSKRALCLRKSVTFYRTIQLLRDCVFFLIENVLALIWLRVCKELYKCDKLNVWIHTISVNDKIWPAEENVCSHYASLHSCLENPQSIWYIVYPSDVDYKYLKINEISISHPEIRENHHTFPHHTTAVWCLSITRVWCGCHTTVWCGEKFIYMIFNYDI